MGPLLALPSPRLRLGLLGPVVRLTLLGNDIDVQTITNYEAIAEIVMFRGARPNDPRSFDARQVMSNLGPRIVLPR